MVRKFFLVLLGLLLFACFTPVYSVLIIAPVIFIFGSNASLDTVVQGATYVSSAVTAIWIIRRLWNPKEPARKTTAQTESTISEPRP